jgi:hypothetical protein
VIPNRECLTCSAQPGAPTLCRVCLEHREMASFIERVAKFRPPGLFGFAEDAIAGLRHDAEAMRERLMRDSEKP